MEFEAVIGLEIHVELNSATKMFCDCPNRPGEEPNLNICPTCLGLPGSLPRLSQQALEKAALLSLTLGAELQPRSLFDQKVYYYPDLPKGYQLSQAHFPLSRGGGLDIANEQGLPRKLRIHHIHMEEDVARLVHETEGRLPVSLVDFNRAGAPLVEIVTEPDLRTPFEAMEFLRALRTQVRYVGASECSMETGTLRADANISIRPLGATQMGTKVEVKNMNSIRHVGDAIGYEIERQIAEVQAGRTVVLHTRLWDPDRKMTIAMRAKFEGPCIPDPSVPLIELSPAWIEEMRARLPEPPTARADRFVHQYGLSHEEAAILTADPEIAGYFETLVEYGTPGPTAAHWLTAQLLPLAKERQQDLGSSRVTPARLALLLEMMAGAEIDTKTARTVLSQMFDSDEDPRSLVSAARWERISDRDSLEPLIERAVSEHQGAVADIRNGQVKALGFLVGQVMQASGGKADPKIVRELLIARLHLPS